jgi:hypothetical protein
MVPPESGHVKGPELGLDVAVSLPSASGSRQVGKLRATQLDCSWRRPSLMDDAGGVQVQ